MMDDTDQLTPAGPETETQADREIDGAQAGPAPIAEDAPQSPSLERFKSCRWRATPEDGEFCTHRDVLPFAGKEGFVADSWCPECAFYKLRRTPKKRDKMDYMY